MSDPFVDDRIAKEAIFGLGRLPTGSSMRDVSDGTLRRRQLPIWPLSNVWLGVSVENQETADQRIPVLLNTPAAVRFVSYEPALGPVDFREFIGFESYKGNVAGQCVSIDWETWHRAGEKCRTCGWGYPNDPDYPRRVPGLDWVIVGGESGPSARPCDVAWIRSTVEQCESAGVPVFVKQLGSKPWDRSERVGFAPGVAYPPYNIRVPKLKDRKGGDMAEWPEDLRVREFPAVLR